MTIEELAKEILRQACESEPELKANGTSGLDHDIRIFKGLGKEMELDFVFTYLGEIHVMLKDKEEA